MSKNYNNRPGKYMSITPDRSKLYPNSSQASFMGKSGKKYSKFGGK